MTFEFAATGTDVELSSGDPVEVWFTKVAGGATQVQLLRNLRTGRLLVDRVNYGAGRFTWRIAGAAVVLLVLIYFAVRSWIMLGAGE